MWKFFVNHKDLSNVGDYDDDLRVWEHPVSSGLFYSPFFRGHHILKETRTFFQNFLLYLG